MKRLFTIGVPIILLLSAVGWRFALKQDQAKTLAQGLERRKTAPANVVTAKAESRDIVKTIDVVGSVMSPFDVKLAPQITGRINYLQVREGDAVHSGEILARIDSSEVEAAVLQAKAALAEAKQRYAQALLTESSTAVGVSSQVQQQSASVASAKANFDQLRQNYAAQVGAADSLVIDAEAKVAAAKAQIQSAQANRDSAIANRDNALAKFNRFNTLFSQGYIAAQDVDDSKTSLKVFEGAVQVAEKSLLAAQSSEKSAEAQKTAVVNQASIVRRKGMAEIVAGQAVVNQQQASLSTARANRSQVPAYKANLEALQASVSVSEAALRQAEAKLSYTTIVSPVEGFVTARTADEGSTANPNHSILEVQFLKWVYVSAPIPVEQSSHVHIGQSVSVSLDSLSGERFAGTIDKLNPSADAQSRQFTVLVKLDNPQIRLRPGMFARVSLELSRTAAEVVVPREAVSKSPSGGNQFVYVVDPQSVVHKTIVETGDEDTSGIQITSGVEEGDKVVVLSYTPLKDGQKIQQGAAKRSKKAGTN